MGELQPGIDEHGQGHLRLPRIARITRIGPRNEIRAD
jgi:hypothetical protein